MIWAYLFFLTLWKTVSRESPGDTALELQLALRKQLLRLCSASGLTLCILSGFSINKTLSPETLSSSRGVGFPLFDSPLLGLPGYLVQHPAAASSQSSS